MSEATKQSEKRLTKRVLPAQDQPVGIVIQGEGCTETTHATNISQHGLGITVSEGFKGCDLDTSVEIEVALPDPVNHSFSARVKIIHQQGSNYGVRFEEVAQKDGEILSRYIDHRLVNADGTSVMKALYGI